MLFALLGAEDDQDGGGGRGEPRAIRSCCRADATSREVSSEGGSDDRWSTPTIGEIPAYEVGASLLVRAMAMRSFAVPPSPG